MRRAVRLVAIGLCGVAVIFGWAGPRSTLRADEAAAKQALLKLLDVGWGDSFRAIEPARGIREGQDGRAWRSARAFRLCPGAHEARQAQRRGPVAGRGAGSGSSARWAREAKIWIDVLLKRYSAALTQIDELSTLLPPVEAKEAGDDVKSRHRETARYLGRLFAFFQGPAEKSVNADRVAAAKKAVIERLSAEHRQEFEAGHKAVSDRFAEFFVMREQTKDDEATRQKTAQEEAAKRLAGDKATVASDKKAVAEQAAQTREQLDKYLSDIDRKLAPLDREYARLSAQAVGVRERMIDLDRDISRLLRQAETTEDRALAARYRLDAERVSEIRSRHAADYRVLENQAGRVRGQQAALLGERDATIARYNAEAKRLGREQVKLAQTEKRIAREEDRNRKPATGNTDRVHALSQKVFAFTTYEPFPLEQAKSRLLESLR